MRQYQENNNKTLKIQTYQTVLRVVQIWVDFSKHCLCVSFFLSFFFLKSFPFSLKHIQIRLFKNHHFFFKESLAVLWQTLTIYNGVAFEQTDVILQIHNAPLISNGYPTQKAKRGGRMLASFFPPPVPTIYKKNSQDLEINKSENVSL